ncbi:MAG TPA: response regulator [Syntrophobacteraceae bacterium]|nr:response regulator [Syntrophobacteraceae bacterium]
MAGKDRPLLLIVDDDIAHRLMLATLFEEWGYRVEEAADGLAALDFIRSNPVDIILMDVRMPRMNGIEATKEIQRIDSDLPIIVMTAYSSLSTGMEALNAGAFDYLTKPLDFDALRAVVDRARECGRRDGEDGKAGRKSCGFRDGLHSVAL